MNTQPLLIKTSKDKDFKRIAILVGGSGDDRHTLLPLVNTLVKRVEDTLFLTFSFSGVEEKKNLPIGKQVDDLKELIQSFHQKYDSMPIVLIATSMGAFSTVYAVSDVSMGHIISEIIFIDPADYFDDMTTPISQMHSWPGIQSFHPERPTVSERLRLLNSDVVVHVIRFTLRNYGPTGYVRSSERGIDNPQMAPRLNQEMVRSFYDNLPSKNRGLFIDENRVPHAFLRDGDKLKNATILAELIGSIFLK